jgi:eukaryotic-like serine/threonine-protein kinase
VALNAGDRVGVYEVTGAIGAGGMGEVYRARDTRLKRDVALKILPQSFASDAERLARFQREAEVLASLNHPNIAAIHGLEESNGIKALVMELVEGPTLADRISQGPIPLDEALPLARQIAEALEAAHERGIIHRDLKPANIKLRSDGVVKVLDFGLAKALDSTPAAIDISHSPTITSPAMMTGVGVLLGTAAYMSPEQTRGKAVDKRSDIWAFGCVLYEMLTGQRAFGGEDVTDTLAAVVRAEPAWDALPEGVSPSVRVILHRCLQKDPKRRLRDIGDAGLEIEEALAAPDVETAAAATAPALGRRERLAWGVAAVAIGAAVVAGALAFVRAAPEPDSRVYRSSILPPAGASLAALPFQRFALSPDGRRLAFAAATGGGLNQLWVQSLDGLTPQSLPGTEGAATPFWSPDSRFIGFYAVGRLKTIDASGGPPLTVAEVGTGNPGATWNRDNVILFSGTGEGSAIRRVSASGGSVSAVTTVDKTNGEIQHWAPVFLPDGRHFLYVAIGTNSGGPTAVNGIYVAALDSNERKLLVAGGASPKYAQGYLLFLREQTLMAQAFDVDRLELTGDPVAIAEQVAIGGLSGRMGALTASENGVLAYQRATGGDLSQLAWFDRGGKPLGVVGDRGDYGDLELSPDGERAAVSFAVGDGNYDIWLFDLARGLRTRFTFDPSTDVNPIWSPDGAHVAFSSNRRGGGHLYQKASSGVGTEDVIQADPSAVEAPLGWSSDGQSILYARTTAAGVGSFDLWVLPLIGDRKPRPFTQTLFNETVGAFSPDGRLVAYVSSESGRNEVYVTPFPAPRGKWQISTTGGNWPRWRRDGRELFYLAPDNRLMAAEVNGAGSGFEVGAVRPLFQTQARINRRFMYDVSADGQRFLINTLVEQVVQPITLVVNWTPRP